MLSCDQLRDQLWSVYSDALEWRLKSTNQAIYICSRTKCPVTLWTEAGASCCIAPVQSKLRINFYRPVHRPKIEPRRYARQGKLLMAHFELGRNKLFPAVVKSKRRHSRWQGFVYVNMTGVIEPDRVTCYRGLPLVEKPTEPFEWINAQSSDYCQIKLDCKTGKRNWIRIGKDSFWNGSRESLEKLLTWIRKWIRKCPKLGEFISVRNWPILTRKPGHI